eukprot:CCRYP_012076-RA/>CCRYP_012076-RA protein AED:0.44 eAED:0.44 QI:0/0/0/1/0/0/3/0/124
MWESLILWSVTGPTLPGAEEALPPNAPNPLARNRLCHLSQLWHDRLAFKKQSTVETSVFGAEFCAMKHGIENLRGIRYKLRMMGVPVKGPSYVYVREAAAMGEALVAHIPTKKNLADLFTKVLY